LLDEIAELPLDMQPKLLRALQERTVRPLGASREVPFDCRIVAAANVNLDAEVSAKRFREDLYYRLDVVRLNVPPLRERGDDVRVLAEHFLARELYSSRRKLTFGTAVMDRLLNYAWPGNVRELENCIERTAALARSDELGPEDLPEKIRFSEGRSGVQAPNAPGLGVGSLVDLERRHTLRALELLHGNMTRAAKLLGIDRTTLYRRLKRYEANDTN
jgi:two-component system response regulator HydG